MPKRAEVILYAEDGWDKGKIISIIELKQSIKEYAFILHDRNLLHNYPLLCALNCCYINGFEDS